MKLKEFLVKERYNARHLSDYCECSHAHMCGVVRGKFFPSRKLADKIEKFTKGQVKASSLTKNKEKKICPTCKRPMASKKKDFVEKIISVE